MKNRHNIPTPLRPETVIVDVSLGMIYRVADVYGETLAVIPKKGGKR